MTPTVSVLVAAYNRAQYIAAAIESVLAQTFRDFELIVVDDGSTDDTAAVAQSYAARDPRVRVVVSEHRGQFPTRNYAASLAAGRYMKFHDSDDVMYPHCLEVMVRMLEAEPRAALAMTRGSDWPGGPCPILSTPRMSYQREFLGWGMLSSGPAAAMFRTEAFRALGGFEVNVGHPADIPFWLKAAAAVNILLVPPGLFWYRIHPGQALQSKQYLRDIARIQRRVWEALRSPACPLSPHEREIAKRNRAYAVAKECYRDMRAGDLGLCLLRCRASGLSVRDWLRYLRPPRRDRMAGTPVDAGGEYVVPAQVFR